MDHFDYNCDLIQVQDERPAGRPKEEQHACGGNADRLTDAQNEILCFRLDGSLTQLVVAPVTTNLAAFGGGTDDNKELEGNLDVTGQFFIWTTNVGSSCLDAFIVKMPGHLL